MKIGICGGGPIELLPEELQADYWIGADSGAIHLLKRNMTPDYITGDLDSISATERKDYHEALLDAVQVSAEKDETDTYLALLKAVELNPTSIEVIGVTGGRLDHYQAILQDVFHFQTVHPNIQFTIRDKFNSMYFLYPGEHRVYKTHYTYCSFFSFSGHVENLTLQGFKYPVSEDTLYIGSSRFTSNEILDESGSIRFSSGICLCIQSREESGE